MSVASLLSAPIPGESPAIPKQLQRGREGRGTIGNRQPLGDNRAMTGIQFVTDEKGHKVAVQIDLKTHGALWEDFRDGMVAESRRKEKSVPYGTVPR
jgi:hypothetical protein